MRDCVPDGCTGVRQLLYGLRRVRYPSENGQCVVNCVRVLIRSEDVLLSIFRREATTGNPVIIDIRNQIAIHTRETVTVCDSTLKINKRAGPRPRPASSTRVATQESSGRLRHAPRMNRTRVPHTTARARHHSSTPHHIKRMPFHCQPSIIVTATLKCLSTV